MIEVQQPDGTWQDLIDLRGESEEVEGSPAEDMLRALKTWKVSTEPLTMPTTYMEIVRERDLLYRRLACAVSALEFYAISGGNATVAQIALTDIKNLE